MFFHVSENCQQDWVQPRATVTNAATRLEVVVNENDHDSNSQVQIDEWENKNVAVVNRL